MAEEQDVDTLKRRGRRRLIGAVALVLLAVIVLPMVFDPEPKTNPPVQIRIPGEGEGGFTPKGARVAPAPAAQSAAAPSMEKPVPQAMPGAAAQTTEKEAVVASPASARPEPAQAAPEADAAVRAAYIVPVAAFASPDKVKEVAATLKSAKLPYYTEPVATAKGPVTRVRAGPFASREVAERARDKLRDLGLKPGNTLAREG